MISIEEKDLRTAGPAQLTLARRSRFRAGAIQALLEGTWNELTLYAHGDSMFPLIRDQDRIRIRRRIPRLGEIVVYARQGQLVVHRLVGLGRRDHQWVYLTRGDNQKGADGWVIPERVLGVVKSWESSGRLHREGLFERLLRAARSSGSYALRRLRKPPD